MAEKGFKRRLAAILSADVAGYIYFMVLINSGSLIARMAKATLKALDDLMVARGGLKTECCVTGGIGLIY